MDYGIMIIEWMTHPILLQLKTCSCQFKGCKQLLKILIKFVFKSFQNPWHNISQFSVNYSAFNWIAFNLQSVQMSWCVCLCAFQVNINFPCWPIPCLQLLGRLNLLFIFSARICHGEMRLKNPFERETHATECKCECCKQYFVSVFACCNWKM